MIRTAFNEPLIRYRNADGIESMRNPRVITARAGNFGAREILQAVSVVANIEHKRVELTVYRGEPSGFSAMKTPHSHPGTEHRHREPRCSDMRRGRREEGWEKEPRLASWLSREAAKFGLEKS